MAFGIRRVEINDWKQSIDQGNIAFLTHYWRDDRFPHYNTVTKVGAKEIEKLVRWGMKYDLKREWIHIRKDGYSHFDLLGELQYRILIDEGRNDHISRFNLNQSR
ncbi:hypothetical protein [Jeotgalibacillus soli]|uniref:YneQ n=1 Tax=Jeotgalibacillus soli TaxID=889306 RepID=A0A0C2VLH0_9BACL|nr:hypothetical protein [Jeotgalibacillus soli]KIL45311.1 hypothetical protein KP78_28550 [Jeotgalibacillus soli]